MKTLLILRHAKSSWDDASVSDHERPLNARGLKSAPQVGQLIKKERLTPEHIVSSTALRAQQTTELVVKHCGYKGDVHSAKELYDSTPESYIKTLRKLPEDYQTVLVVGHNPILEMLVELLTDEHHNLPTASLVQLELPIAHWRELAAKTPAKLRNFWKPKELD